MVGNLKMSCKNTFELQTNSFETATVVNSREALRHDMKLEWKLKEKETDEELQLEKLRIISFCFYSQHLQPMGKGRVKKIL